MQFLVKRGWLYFPYISLDNKINTVLATSKNSFRENNRCFSSKDC